MEIVTLTDLEVLQLLAKKTQARRKRIFETLMPNSDILLYIEHLEEVVLAARECFDRQTDHHARWAMEDVQKALVTLDKFKDENSIRNQLESDTL